MGQDIVIHHGRNPEILEWLRSAVSGVINRAYIGRADSMRIELNPGQHPSFEGYSDRHYYITEEGGSHDVIDATTEDGMRRARELLLGETMATPQPAQSAQPAPTPAIRDCVILLHRDRNLINQVYDDIISIDGRMEGHLPTRNNPVGSLAVSLTPGLSGFNSDNGEWFRGNDPYIGWPMFDAATQMDNIRAHFGLIPASAAPVIADPRDRDPGKPTLGNAIIVADTPELNEEVQHILFKAGHGWVAYGQVVRQHGSPVLLAGKYVAGDTERVIRHSSETRSPIRAHPDWPVFNAASEMDRIYRYYGVKREAMSLERLVKPPLLNLIRSIPSDDAVAGFIRRDLHLVLPQEVQDQGSDAICKWIVEQKVGPEAAAALPKQPVVTPAEGSVVATEITASFHYRERVSGRDYWRRIDRVEAEITVPASVVQEAVDARDFNIIREWLRSNIEESSEEDRDRGDSDTYDGDEDGSEFEGLAETSELEEQFNNLLNAE